MDKRKPTRPLQLHEESRILVRVNNWIGDVVISTPALRAIRKSYPRATISVLAKPWVLPLLKTSPHIDCLLPYESLGRHKGFMGKHRLAADLKRERFDCTILLQRAFEAAYISFLARVPRRAGLCTDGRSLLLTHRVRAEREIFQIHRVKHNLELLARLGIPSYDTSLVLPVGVPETVRAQAHLAASGVSPGTFCFGLNPGAAFGTAKRWKPSRFAELSLRLAREFGPTGLLFGSPGERELGDEICAMAPDAGLVNLAGVTTLEEAVALIGLCGLFVTNDSGLMHVAAALDVPLVSIFGPTNPRVTSPWCKRHRLVRKEGVSCGPCMQRECKEEHHLCMESVTTDDVYLATTDLLTRFGAESPEKRREHLRLSDRTVPVRTLGPAAGQKDAAG